MNRCVFILLVFTLCSCRETRNNERQAIPALLSGNIEQIKINNFRKSDLMDSVAINRQIEYATFFMRQYYNRDSAKSARRLLWEAYQNSREINYHKGMVNALSSIGLNYNYLSMRDSALYYYKAALPYLAHFPPEYCHLEWMHARIGSIYYNLAQPDSALFYVYKGLDNLKRHKIKGYRNAFFVYKTAGGIWLNMGNLKAATPYLDSAANMALLLKDSALMMEVVSIKATLYYGRGILDSAILLYKMVLNNNATDIGTQINANYNMGTMYASSDNKYEPAQSIPYFENAIQLCYQLHGPHSLQEIKYLFGLSVGYINKGNKEKSLADTKKGESILLKINQEKAKTVLAGNLPLFYSNLAILYGNQQRYKEAYEQGYLALKMRDSLYAKEKLEMMGSLDVQYRVADKDKKIAQHRLQILKQQNKLKEKNMLIYGSGFSALLLAAFLFSAYRSIKHKKGAHAKELLLLQQQLEINQLKAVMQGEEQERTRIARELHDGVGGLLAAIKLNISTAQDENNLQTKAEDLKDAMELVEHAVDEVRITAHNLMPDILQRYNLPEALRMYSNLHSGKELQIDLQFHMEWVIPDKSFELSLYRILQELIQNIIKHAKAKHATIQFRHSENMLHIIIEDDGTGYNSQHILPGLGLKNIHSRVAVLKGHIEIETGPGRGTTTYIELPFDNE